MVIKDISLLSPQENILFDDVLLSLAESGHSPEVLRFWESPQLFIVLGKTGKLWEDVYTEKARQDGVPVLRRSSGGGTVLQGKGCFNFSLILSKDRHPDMPDLRRSYRYILGKVMESLARLGIKSAFQPISDLALAENSRKISGNAQKRGKKFILHHGTLLYNFDLSKIEYYLKIPKSVPDYRQGRPHLEFVTNVSAAPVELKAAVRKVFFAEKENSQPTLKPADCLQKFLESNNSVLILE